MLCIRQEGWVGFGYLQSHPSHVLQPIDIACFKLFKTTFRFSMDVWILTNKVKGVRKEDLTQ
jgi:hypothetical protein